MKKKNKVRIFILLGVFFYVFWMSACKVNYSDRDENYEYVDTLPMIMYNDCLYGTTTYPSGGGETFSYIQVGEIKSYKSFGVPIENFQANSDMIGSKIYISELKPKYIFVLYKGRYEAYKLMEE